MNRRALLVSLLAVPAVALGLKTVGPTEVVKNVSTMSGVRAVMSPAEVASFGEAIEGVAGSQRVGINVDNKAEWEAFLQEIYKAVLAASRRTVGPTA